MTGRAEVDRLKRRLDATFERVRAADIDTELRSDLAKYLCVLVSGYIEKAVEEFILEHARRTGAPTLQRFVSSKTKYFPNPKAKAIQELLGSFDPKWRQELQNFLADGSNEAVDSIVNLRNQIAHGISVGLSYHNICSYYQQAQSVVDQIGKICVPDS